jgi:SAM-dependent methyltransferase
MNLLFFELRYALGTPPWDSGVSPPELLDALDKQPAGSALDVGCGTGTNLVTMAARGWQVTGIDLSFLATRRARRKLARAGLAGRVLRADVSRPIDMPDPFDLCLDLGCSHTLPDSRRPAYVANLARWLRPGATLLVYSFYRPADAPETHWPTLEGVLSSFAPRFAVEQVEKGDFRGSPSVWLKLRRNAE